MYGNPTSILFGGYGGAGDLLRRNAEVLGGQTGLIFGDRRWSWREVNARANRFANALRALAMDAVERAKSGHPGMPMGMADVATVLFTRELKFDASAPEYAAVQREGQRTIEAYARALEAREALDAVERRQRVDRALADADAIDLESARLLTEVALGGESDIEGAVADLRRRKPFLFRSRGVRAGPAPGGRAPQAAEGLIEAAEEAARTGDRRALLRYLDLRRGA